ncbi:DUF6455 family protein [Thioclava sp. A2]|uniref:DUF6455 family protein n=1 Tax=Thioclava sp. FCG-A2 TaxID=3080562 RepID=UPI002955DF6B|nr:DUF6455 family protein [Thioclava sp. A2]MDV7270424.1 DUF6455 family protein [Thioclava sp. A2]
MGMQGNIDLNFWLTRSLARKMGVNLTEAMHSGFLTQEDFAQMITACRCCAHGETCLAYLSESGGPAETAPECCSNKEILGELSALMRRH